MRNIEIYSNQNPVSQPVRESLHTNTGMRATDIYRNPRLTTINFIRNLNHVITRDDISHKMDLIPENDKLFYFGEMLRLLDWVYHKTHSIEQKSLSQFNLKLKNSGNHSLIGILSDDYKRSRERLLQEVMKVSIDVFPKMLRLDWVNKFREETAPRDNPISWGKFGERVRFSARDGKVIFEGQGPVYRDGLPRTAQYIYGNNCEVYPNTRAYEEVDYLDAKLPLISANRVYYPTNNEKFNKELFDVQILVKPKNTKKYAYVVVNFSADGKIEKNYIEHDPFFEGDEKNLQETLTRLGVLDERDVSNISIHILRGMFLEYANKGKPIDKAFYKGILKDETIMTPDLSRSSENKKRAKSISEEDWKKMEMDKIIPYLELEKRGYGSDNLRLAHIVITNKIGGLSNLAEHYMEAYVLYYARLMAKEPLNYKNIKKFIAQYSQTMQDFIKFITEIPLNKNQEDVNQLEILRNRLEDKYKLVVKESFKLILLPNDCFKDIAWLKELDPVFGYDYFFYNNRIGEVNHREPIDQDHFQYSSDTSSFPLHEKETNPPERLTESLMIINGHSIKMQLISGQNPSGKRRRMISIYAISNYGGTSEKSIVYHEDGKYDISSIGVGGGRKYVIDEKIKLSRLGFPTTEDVPLQIDFENTWKKSIEAANFGKPPENILDLLVINQKTSGFENWGNLYQEISDNEINYGSDTISKAMTKAAVRVNNEEETKAERYRQLSENEGVHSKLGKFYHKQYLVYRKLADEKKYQSPVEINANMLREMDEFASNGDWREVFLLSNFGFTSLSYNINGEKVSCFELGVFAYEIAKDLFSDIYNFGGGFVDAKLNSLSKRHQDKSHFDVYNPAHSSFLSTSIFNLITLQLRLKAINNGIEKETSPELKEKLEIIKKGIERANQYYIDRLQLAQDALMLYAQVEGVDIKKRVQDYLTQNKISIAI